MLTPPQMQKHKTVFYGQICGANRWRMEDGRMHPDARKNHVTGYHQQVWNFAGWIAQQEHRAVIVNDLRKGMYMLAIGRPKSLTKFDDQDFDRFLSLAAVLINPDDLRAVMEWQRYERFDRVKREIASLKAQGLPCDLQLPDDPGEIRRQLYFIRQTPAAVLQAICRDRFDGRQTDDMDLKELRQLTMMLKNRRTYQQPQRTWQPKREPVEQPF